MRKRVIPAAIACAGAAALLYWIGRARPLWVDEEMLLLNVRDRTFSELGGALWLDQSAPLGWLALERLALLLLGHSERALRLLPVLFGISTLGTAVWIGRRWMTTLGASILVALCAFGEWIVFFTLELKHYSADTFGALLVPALAVWAIEANDTPELLQRATTWWAVAAVALWFSNGAIFVAPGCALALAVVCWRRDRWRAFARSVGGGLMWLASFAACYVLVLRHAVANTYLRNYWAFAFPPVSEGPGAVLTWLLGQFRPVAIKPAGSGLWLLFWIAYAAGILFAIITRRRIGLVFALTPLSALALAFGHVLPTFERLALWAVPSLYVGIALCGDAAVRLAAGALSIRRRRALAVVSAAAAGVAALGVSGDVVYRGVMALAHKPQSNYGLDDRSGIRTLLAMHQPGDVVLTTHYGLAALWWYGQIDVSDPDRTVQLADGSPVYELEYVEPGAACERGREKLAAALTGHRRTSIYLGFRLNVLPVGFDSLVTQEFSSRGALVGFKQYAEESRVAVFDLSDGPSSARAGSAGDSDSGDPAPLPPGCVSVSRARRW